MQKSEQIRKRERALRAIYITYTLLLLAIVAICSISFTAGHIKKYDEMLAEYTDDVRQGFIYSNLEGLAFLQTDDIVEYKKVFKDALKQNDLYNSYAMSAAMQPHMCDSVWLKDHPVCIHHEKQVFLYFGNGGNIMEIHMQQTLVSRDDKVREMIAKITDISKEINDTSVLYDITVYRRIVIQNDDGRLLSLSLSTLYYMYPELPVCILNCTEDTKTDLVLCETAGTDRQGLRLLFHDEDELKEYLKNSQQEYLCIFAPASENEAQNEFL